MEEFPGKNQENISEENKYNPNSISEVISIGNDLPTQPDKVYRSVRSEDAIDDIENSGVVRNKQSAGLVEKSRWGDRVFWSRGGEGKYHIVQKGGYVIEAPLSVAQEREVTREDITAIYTKNENGEVFDVLEQKRQQIENEKQKKVEEVESKKKQRLSELRKELGIGE